MSILGDSTNLSKSIKENVEAQYLEFYVAGYTKKCKGIDVQNNHSLLYSDSMVVCGKSSDTFEWPFGYCNHDIARVELMPEPENRFDPYATIIAVEYPLNMRKFIDGKSDEISLIYLGYVPAEISKIISNNIHRLGLGWIRKTRRVGTFHSSRMRCNTKIAIPWKVTAGEDDETLLTRIDNIISDW